MGLLLVVALVLAWPTFGLSLVAWCLLVWFSAAAKAANKKHIDQRRAVMDLAVRGRDAEFFLALDMPLKRRAELTPAEAEQCGRHVLNYVAHNSEETALLMRGVEKHSLRNGGAPFDAIAAAANETWATVKAEMHLVAYRGIVAVSTNNPNLQCFSKIEITTLRHRIRDIESTLRKYAADPQWVQVVRDWLTFQTDFDSREAAKVGAIENVKHLLLGHAVYEPCRPARSLPREIGMLTKLEVAHLQRNELTALPNEIGDLKNLRVLKLGGNRLRTFPASIGRLENLEVLTAWSNDLVSVPSEIGQLRKLKGLCLTDNPLAKLPDEITQLRELECLELSGLPNLRLSEAQIAWISHLSAGGCDVSDVDDFGTANPDLHAAQTKLALARYRHHLSSLEREAPAKRQPEDAMISGHRYLRLFAGREDEAEFDEAAMRKEIEALCGAP